MTDGSASISPKPLRSAKRRLMFVLIAGALAIVGALIAASASGSPSAKWLGLLGVVLASINIFGGFAVTQRMLAMYKKKAK